MSPFDYPTKPHLRRHGPTGYATAESYRPWLRDEFAFRCVYCLRRERWEPGQTAFEIDHWLSLARTPELALIYDNLLYTCDVCNSVKGNRELADPCQTMLSDNLTIEADGRILGRTSDARRIIRVLGLNDAEFILYRARWIKIIALAKLHDPGLFQQLSGYPDDLPDLSTLRPPKGNTRPEGIEASYQKQRERKELPTTY